MTNDNVPVPARPNAGPLMVRPATALFGGAHSARETINEAKEIAKVLAETLRESPALVSQIEIRRGGQVVEAKEHVNFEGWTMLGVLLGAVNGASVHADVEWTRRIPPGEGQPPGWEARAVARMSDGTYLSSAEMMCTRDENRWTNRDDFQIRSMAQTRAQAKALRQVLGWIMSLAGYATTPAEEMEAIDAETRRAARAVGGTAPPSQFQNVGQLMTWAMRYGNETGYPLDSRAVTRIVGVERPNEIKDLPAAATAIVDAVQRALGGPPPEESGGSVDTGGEPAAPEYPMPEGLTEDQQAEYVDLIERGGMKPEDAETAVREPDGDDHGAAGRQGEMAEPEAGSSSTEPSDAPEK